MAMLTTTTTTRTLISTLSMVSSKRRIGRPTIDGKMAAGKLAPAKPHLTNYTHQVESTHAHAATRRGQESHASEGSTRTRTRERAISISIRQLYRAPQTLEARSPRSPPRPPPPRPLHTPVPLSQTMTFFESIDMMVVCVQQAARTRASDERDDERQERAREIGRSAA